MEVLQRELDAIKFEERDMAPYWVGALMYCPALSETVADGVIEGRFGSQYSLALCLEDAISDSAVENAETLLAETLGKLCRARETKAFYLPPLFVRVREAAQIERLARILADTGTLITGFVLPKISADNVRGYLDAVRTASERAGRRIYMMPTLESREIVELGTRREALDEIRDALSGAPEYVLNVRVGGNDFCRDFGVRRHFDQTIYEIGPVAGILYDILTYFSRDFVVAGPVFEYFGGLDGQWQEGLAREIQMDRLNGFIGKTVIHPNQIAVFNKAMRVDESDLRDALAIRRLAESDRLLVEKSAAGERMNEYKTHLVWAEKTIRLAKIYGVKERWSKREEGIIPL